MCRSQASWPKIEMRIPIVKVLRAIALAHGHYKIPERFHFDLKLAAETHVHKQVDGELQQVVFRVLPYVELERLQLGKRRLRRQNQDHIGIRLSREIKLKKMSGRTHFCCSKNGPNKLRLAPK